MYETLAVFVALSFLTTAWVYRNEVKFQERKTGGVEENRKAAIQSAYVGVAIAAASALLRVFFILFGIDAVFALMNAANTSALGPAIAIATLISGSVVLVERAGRAYSIFVIDRRLHLNNTTVSMYLTDTLKALLVSALFTLPLIAAWVWLLEPRTTLWWLAAWALWFLLLSVRTLVKPHLETMLFAKAHDLPEGELRSRLTGVLERSGVKASSLRVNEASKRTSRLNASVTGLGAHKHILLFDTLVRRLGAAEVEAVLAHEAGHVHYGHLAKSWAGLGLVGLAGAYVISEAVDVFGLQPAEAIGLTLAVYPSALLFLRPLFVTVSRSFEFQADAFAARQCSAEVMGDALRAIFDANRGVYEHHWSYAALFSGHPSGTERLRKLTEMDQKH